MWQQSEASEKKREWKTKCLFLSFQRDNHFTHFLCITVAVFQAHTYMHSCIFFTHVCLCGNYRSNACRMPGTTLVMGVQPGTKSFQLSCF